MIKHAKETVVCISSPPGQACLTFVVYVLLSTATVSKLTESGLNRACTATVSSVGEASFVVNWSEFPVLFATVLCQTTGRGESPPLVIR